MKLIFWSAPTFETWSYLNPDTVGIGGSETSHIEMAIRLAHVGHQVISYTPSEEPAHEYKEVQWRPCESVDFAEPCDVWIVYRDPSVIDRIPAGAIIWLICQDVDYPALTHTRAERCARIVALCKTHQDFLQMRYPRANVCQSSNGVKSEIITRIKKNPPPRDPHRLIYASSPDRGLDNLLEIFPRVREVVPDAELHVYYGFDNLDKVEKWYGPKITKANNRLKMLLRQPGVNWHGRMGQPELLGEWFKSAIWCHPSNFTETSCITCMDAQSCGAIPVSNPIWAVGQNVEHGVLIQGDVTNELIRARYVHNVVSLMLSPETQEKIRKPMMDWAPKHFWWNNYVRQWSGWANDDVRQQKERAA